MLCEIISIIVFTGLTDEAELEEVFFVAEPIPSHIPTFGFFVIEFDKIHDDWNGHLAVVEEFTSFDFGGGWHDVAEGFALCVNGAIRLQCQNCWWLRWHVGEEEEACYLAASIEHNKISGIR